MSKVLNPIISVPAKDSRLHLYVASACPFCHRVIAALEFTGLADNVTYTWMQNVKGVEGWAINPDEEPAFNETYLSNVYFQLDPKSEYRPSVPLLVDLSNKAILSTSSTDMTHYFAKGMNGLYELSVNLFTPSYLKKLISLMYGFMTILIERFIWLVFQMSKLTMN